MDVSIIIINYKTEELTVNCLESIKQKTNGINYEVIVIDNDSQDASIDNIMKAHPWAKYIKSSENLGFGKANNLAAKEAVGKYVFFLNSDTELINNAIKILFDFMENAPKDAGACGANLYYPDGSINFSYTTYFPTLLSHILYRSYMIKFYSAENFNTTEEIKKVSQVIGAHLFMRRDIFNEIGGFDPFYFMYVEDTDIQKTLSLRGLHVYSVPKAKIMHLQGASSVSFMKLKWEIDSYRHYYAKFYDKNALAKFNMIEKTSLKFRKILYKIQGRKEHAAAVDKILKDF